MSLECYPFAVKCSQRARNGLMRQKTLSSLTFSIAQSSVDLAANEHLVITLIPDIWCRNLSEVSAAMAFEKL